MMFYHRRLSNEPTGTIVSLWFLWFLNNVENNVEMKVRHKTTPTRTRTKGAFENVHRITLMF